MKTKSQITQTVSHRAPDEWSSSNGTADGYYRAKTVPVLADLLQTTSSEGHPWYSKKYRDRDLGGPFTTEKFTWDDQYADRLWTIRTRYQAPHCFRDGNVSAMVPYKSEIDNLRNSLPWASDSVMDSWGTSAIASVIPTKSKADLAVAAAELISGGLPSLIGSGLLKSKLKDFRKVGDEYLNIEFGIKPLISDIQKTSQAIVDAEKTLKQLERDSGRRVRRRFAFPDRVEMFESHATGAAAVPAGWTHSYLWNGFQGNRRYTTTQFSTKRWFSGAFTYHLNIGDKHRSQLADAADKARLLLGVKLDAEVLWNLAPWSWLADWFGNVGDITTNISHFSRDGLVMPYGYMMAEQQTIKTSLLYDLNWYHPSQGPRTVRTSASFVRKQRRAAHPFGFGLSDMLLDTRQTAILGALGISKVPRR